MLIGWGTRIRTSVDGVRVRSPAARRSPKLKTKSETRNSKLETNKF
jgi:hypothetical protein